MKNLIIILIGLILINCTALPKKNWLDFNVPNELKSIENISKDQIDTWVYKNIKYVAGAGKIDQFYPGETIENRYGNCVDLTFLKLALYYKLLDEKGDYKSMWKSGTAIGHSFVWISGEARDSTSTHCENSVDAFIAYAKKVMHNDYYFNETIKFENIQSYIDTWKRCKF